MTFVAQLSVLAPWALIVVACLPVAGALFALVTPGADRLALRYVGMGTSLCAALAGVAAALGATGAPVVYDLFGLRLSLDGLSAPLLLSLVVATPIALRSGAPRIFERTQFYVVTVLFAEGMLAAALVVDSPLLRLAVAAVGAVPFYALVALFGGPLRGTTTLRAAMIWLIVDIAALSVVAWLSARGGVSGPQAGIAELAASAAGVSPELKPWIFLALAAPGLVRLAAGPFSVWLAPFLEEAPVSAGVLACCGAAPLGAHLVVRIALPICPEGLRDLLPLVALIAALSALLSGVIAVAERDLRRLLALLVQAAGATSAVAMLCFDEQALAAGLVHVVVTGAAAALVLAALEAVERRFETRDVVELSGLGQMSPGLAAFLLCGLLALAGIPAVGAGTTLWSVAAPLASAPGLRAAGLAPLTACWLAAALVAGGLLGAAGIAGTARRLLQPPPARKFRPAHESLTSGQAARLFFPAGVVLAAGLGAGSLVELAVGPAREIVGRVLLAVNAGAAASSPFSARRSMDDAAADAPAAPDLATGDATDDVEVEPAVASPPEPQPAPVSTGGDVPADEVTPP